MKNFFKTSLTMLIIFVIIASSACNRNPENIKLDGIYILPAEDFTYLWPQYFDFEMAKEKGLTKEAKPSKTYSAISSMYRKALETYLFNTYDIAKYDNELAGNNPYFTVVPEEKQNIYQKWTSTDCKYLYLRNHLYVERLPQEDINILLKRVFQNNTSIDDELLHMVERTYKDIITVKYSHDDSESFGIAYSKGSDAKMAGNNSLVFELSYQIDFDEKGNFANEENMYKQNKFINDFAALMSEELTQVIGIPVTVFFEKK